jgi:site-specific DNA-methyltransferase (adenine-specific)
MDYEKYGQVYRAGKITLINCDCMDLLRDAPGNYWDLSCVDPPYGIGESGGKLRTKKTRPNSWKSEFKHEKKSWDSNRPDKYYFDEIKRISKNQIIWGANFFSDFLPPSSCWIMWDKNIGGDQADGELAYTSFKTAIRLFKGHPFIGTGGGKERIHPVQKPVVLYKWLLTNYAKPGQRILDTHLGSGSSAIAAHYFGCDFVGCELDTDYYEAAVRRFNDETAQQAMEL